jgi:hypothetical protein
MLSVGDLVSCFGAVCNIPLTVSMYVPDSVRFNSDGDDLTVSDVHDSPTAHGGTPSLCIDIGDTLKSCDKLLAINSDVNLFPIVPPLTIDGCTSSSTQSLLIRGRFDGILGDVPTDIGVVAGL